MEYSRIVYFFQTHTNTQCRRPIQEVREVVCADFKREPGS